MVTFANGHAGEIDEEPIQPAGDPRGDVGHLRFVVVDLADHANFVGGVLPSHGRRPDFRQSHGPIRHLQLPRTGVIAPVVRKRDQVHEADRAFAGLG